MISPVPLMVVAAQSAFTPNSFAIKRAEAETRAMYQRYGDCVVSLSPKAAGAIILENVDNQTLIKRRRQLVKPDCLRPAKGMMVMVTLQADRIRYSVADALVRTELAAAPVPNLAGVPPLSHWDAGQPPSQVMPSGKRVGEKDYQEKFADYHERFVFSQFSRFGECVVRTDAKGAKALLLTTPDSAEEDAAFAAVKPALANCVPEGETIALTRLPVRGTIAVNYYRLANASRWGVQQVAKP